MIKIGKDIVLDAWYTKTIYYIGWITLILFAYGIIKGFTKGLAGVI